MIRKITLLFLLCFGVMQVSNAQTECGFDKIHQYKMQTDPAYAQRVNQLNSSITQWLSNQNNQSLLNTTSSGDTVYEIPVVVHVMHVGDAVGGQFNISKGRIDSTIDYLNKTFEANWGSYPSPGSGGTKVPFTFKLAQRAPNCTATNGVNRINVTTVAGYGVGGYDYGANGVRRNNATGVRDDSLKRLSVWPNDRYYNIWVVNKIDTTSGYYPGSSFIAGYAYFPGASPAVDGTVMLASQMRPGRVTLPHEIGHAFALYHTFEDSDPSTSTCIVTPTGNCATEGDRCCDTEPHYQYGAGTCYSGSVNPCTGATYGDATAKNIMNYANNTCRSESRFTPDQRDRMIATMLGSRSDLISSSATLPLPTTPLPTVCTPGISNPSGAIDSGPRRLRIEDAVGSRVYIDANTAGGYNSDGAVAYLDRTCEHQIRLQAGKSYKMTFYSTFFDKGAAFIDYNNDGNLGNSAGERLAIVDNGGGNEHSVTFTVPFNATSCTPIRLRIKSDRTSNYIDSCSNTVRGQTEDYEVLIFGTNSTSASVSLANPPKGGNPSCTGSTLTFNATPSTGVTVVSYQWYINSTEVVGATADSLQSTIFANNDTVKVALRYANLCGVDTVYSDSIIVKRQNQIAPQVGLAIDKGTNPTCIDDTITFRAVPISNPGAAPTYKWRSNGVVIAGQTGVTFNAFNRVGEDISVVMTSSAGACAVPDTALSPTIKIRDTTKRPIAQIALTTGTNPGCTGRQLTFTATPQSGGTAPTYQWTVNGNNVSGATGSTFTTSSLTHNDLVRVIMTSNSACATPKTVTSDSIEVRDAKMTADIVIALTFGVNPACEGKTVIFEANTINGGGGQQYQWFINGVPTQGATSAIYATDSLKDDDSITCVLTTNDSCVNNKTDTSNIIKMDVTPSLNPSVSVAITDGKNPGCIDSLIQFTATATDLGGAPNYEWIINGFPAASGSIYNTTTLLTGNVIVVRANQTDNACYLPDTVYSNPMVMTRSETPPVPVISLIGNMIRTNFDSSFVWTGPNGIMGQFTGSSAYPDTIGPYYAVSNNNGCWSGHSNVLRITLLDIRSIDISNMKVYPNPASDKVIFDWDGNRVSYDIEVRNAMGQIVKYDEIKDASRKVMSLNGLASGNYFVVLKDAQGKAGVVKIAIDNNNK